MKIIFTVLFLASIAIVASCDVRSGIAKKDMEKYVPPPTPDFTPLPEPTPVDPADIMTVDVNLQGERISINGYKLTQSITCKKFDPVMINGDDNVFTIKGACRQIMLNGDRNKITADATTEIVLNGVENTVSYKYFPNGKQPLVIENQAGNLIEKIKGAPAATRSPANKKAK